MSQVLMGFIKIQMNRIQTCFKTKCTKLFNIFYKHCTKSDKDFKETG